MEAFGFAKFRHISGQFWKLLIQNLVSKAGVELFQIGSVLIVPWEPLINRLDA